MFRNYIAICSCLRRFLCICVFILKQQSVKNKQIIKKHNRRSETKSVLCKSFAYL